MTPSRLVDLASLRHDPAWKQWQELASGAPPFLGPEFFTLVSRFHEQPAVVAMAWDGDRLAGALPLLRERDRLTSLRCDYTPGFDYAGDADGIRTIWETLRADGSWNELVLDKLPIDSLLAVHLQALANADGCPTIARLDARHPRFALHGFEAALSAKFLTNLRRCERKAGGVELERIANPDRAAFDEALAIEAMAWKGSAGTSIDADPRAAYFYRVLSRLTGRRGTGSLYFLRAGGRRIATLFAVDDHHTLFALKIGYDPTVANLSPGHLLVWKVAREAEARGLQTFDFVGHDDEWKRKWTANAQEHISLTIYNDSAAGLLRFGLRNLLRPHLPRQLSKPWLSVTRAGCQRDDIVGTHSLVERARGRIDHGLGIKSGLARVLRPPPKRGHLGSPSQFAAGDWVRVKTHDELAPTLDKAHATRGLLFAPSQSATAGEVFQVTKQVRRLRDDHGQFRPISRTVLLQGVDCAGTGPGAAGCGRHCPMMYRDEWLEPAAAPKRGPTQGSDSQHARVRPLEEIMAGLDHHGRRSGVTFLPEMEAFAGKRFPIASKITTVFEYDRWVPTRTPIYVLAGLQCTGAALGDRGPCDRACSLLWAEDWLVIEH